MPSRIHRETLILSLSALLTLATFAGSSYPIYAQRVNQTRNLYSNNLVISFTLYGINSTTGNVFAFVNAHGTTQSKLFNATRLETMENNTSGIAETSFLFQNLALRAGEQFTTCVVIQNTAKMICATDYKTPFPRPQYIDISIH